MAHLVRQIQENNPQEIACGVMRKLTGVTDFANLDIAHVTITGKTRKHFHKVLTECYYVLRGSMAVELDGAVEQLTPGSLLMIHPNTPHRATKTSVEDAEILVICCPPWQVDDEIYVD